MILKEINKVKLLHNISIRSINSKGKSNSLSIKYNNNHFTGNKTPSLNLHLER